MGLFVRKDADTTRKQYDSFIIVLFMLYSCIIHAIYTTSNSGDAGIQIKLDILICLKQ